MSSRDHILNKIRQNQPALTTLPAIKPLYQTYEDNFEQFKNILTTIGGKMIEVADYEEIDRYIQATFTPNMRIIGNIPELKTIDNTVWKSANPHELADVELSVFKATFAVAENSAVWLSDADMVQRVAPFICQHLAVIVEKDTIVATMHEAYDKIGEADYGFGVFIAGPSKTADIEQSLVLGAHGARTMTVFVVEN